MTKNNQKMTQNNSRQPKMTKNDAKKQSVTDQRTDGRTDRPTDGPTEWVVESRPRDLKKFHQFGASEIMTSNLS